VGSPYLVPGVTPGKGVPVVKPFLNNEQALINDPLNLLGSNLTMREK
jgi:hypothetical protein